MGLYDEVVEVPRRTMVLFFLVDTSGSMTGAKIGTVNSAIEEIVPEFGGADKKTAESIGGYMKEHIKEFLTKYDGMSGEAIAQQRYDRFRNF